MEAEAVAEFDIQNMQEGQFISFEKSDYVLYPEKVDVQSGLLSNVFLKSKNGNSTKVIIAETAELSPVTYGESRSVIFHNGYAYDLDLKKNKDSILHFGTLKLALGADTLNLGYKRKSESTAKLAQSNNPKDIAEFQWRISTPLATLVLAMLAVPLSRSAPREGNHGNFFIAMLIYVGFLNLISVAKNWVGNGEVSAFPGIWWVYIVGLALIVLLMSWPAMRLRRKERMQ